MVTIQPLSRQQLPLCVPYARLFHAEFSLPGAFHPSVWLRNWQVFYDRYDGIIFGLWKDGRLVGGFGAIVTPDVSDGHLSGQEMFIFINPHERVGTGFMKLVKAFDAWGKERKLETRIVHLHHKNPTEEQRRTAERLQAFYEKQGYYKLETCFVRPYQASTQDAQLLTSELSTVG